MTNYKIYVDHRSEIINDTAVVNVNSRTQSVELDQTVVPYIRIQDTVIVKNDSADIKNAVDRQSKIHEDMIRASYELYYKN